MLSAHVSFFRNFSNLKRFFHAGKRRPLSTPPMKYVNEKEAKGETANVYRCSLDARHYHLMIHGEALARRYMNKKRFYVCKHREKTIAMLHLKRLQWLQTCFLRRKISKVNLDEKPVSYPEMHPNILIEKHCPLSRIAHFPKS
jgi:hypothetical protein